MIQMTTGLNHNPFVLAPLESNEQNLMVDREEQVKKVGDFVRYHSQGTVLIIGDRGIGKTSLLNKLANLFHKEYNTVTSMIGIYHFELDKIGFIAGILQSIVNELEKKGINTQKYQGIINQAIYEKQERIIFNNNQGIIGRIGNDREIRTIIRPDTYLVEEKARTMLSEIAQTHGKIILLIDDLDKLNDEETSSILLQTRHVLSIPNVFMIFSVNDHLTRFMGKEIQITRSVSDLEITLTPLEYNELIEIIRRRLATTGIDDVHKVFNEEALKEIIELSKGNTREFIAKCSEALDILLSNSLSCVDSSVVRKTISSQREALLSGLDGREVLALKYITDHRRVRAGDNGVTALLKVGRPRASQIFNQLQERGLLLRENLGRNTYYSVPEWVKRLLLSKR